VRIALLHPTYWPEVRRGSERLIHDLATVLAAAGEDVTILTSHDGPRQEAEEDGFTVVRDSRPPAFLTNRRGYEDHLGRVPAVLRALTRGDFDVAHAFFNVDAWAAVTARRMGGPPVVFSMNGIPVREYLVKRRYRLPMAVTAAAEAEVCSVLSESAAARFRRYLLREPRVVPGAVFGEAFAVDEPRADQPTLLFAGDPDERRKGADLLLRAFARVRAELPEARLVFAGRPAQPGRPLPDGAEWLEADETGVLARGYASAWASVLPAREEAFGLVVVESLAAGTPVIAARSGGPPELLDTEGVGELVEPEDEDALALALLSTLEAPPDAEAAARCKAHAARWDWERVLPQYRALYDEALSR
jgi:phosphatidylinositol alpha-mannosyltransferase